MELRSVKGGEEFEGHEGAEITPEEPLLHFRAHNRGSRVLGLGPGIWLSTWKTLNGSGGLTF